MLLLLTQPRGPGEDVVAAAEQRTRRHLVSVWPRSPHTPANAAISSSPGTSNLGRFKISPGSSKPHGVFGKLATGDSGARPFAGGFEFGKPSYSQCRCQPCMEGYVYDDGDPWPL